MSTVKTDNERYLEDEVERYREEARQRSEETAERLRRSREEAKDQYQYSLRTAESWPGALRNQAILMENETGLDDLDNGDDMNTFFTDGVKACKRALVLWHDIEAIRQREIDGLKARLAGIQDEIRQAVAIQLSIENTRRGWAMVADALHTEDDYNAWLDW